MKKEYWVRRQEKWQPLNRQRDKFLIYAEFAGMILTWAIVALVVVEVVVHVLEKLIG